jgi:hypothetical protein
MAHSLGWSLCVSLNLHKVTEDILKTDEVVAGDRVRIDRLYNNDDEQTC